MKQQFLKQTGLSEDQFYKQYPTPESYFNKYPNMKKYAMGGEMNQQNNSGDLTHFNEGGTHEQNPLGGIPQGQNQNGQPNTVEQGETKKGSFVYSNRLSIDENMAKQMNLPSYIKGKTFADASKSIESKFKDRNDKPSLATKKELLDRLSNAQETLKQQEQQRAQELAQNMQTQSQEIPDQMNGEIPEGMEEYTEQNQMFLGGDTAGETNPYMSSIQGGMGVVNSLIAGDSKSAQSGAIKTGFGLAGTAIGGPVGGMVGGMVGDTVNGVIGSISARKEEDRKNKREAFTASNQFSNNFAKGGDLRPWEQASSNRRDDPNYNMNNEAVPFESSIDGYLGQNKRPQINPVTGSSVGFQQLSKFPTTTIKIPQAASVSEKNTDPSFGSKVSDYLDKNGGKFMKYSPVAMNAYQLSQLKKPPYQQLDRMANKYNPNFTDEKMLQNIVANQSRNTIGALTNATNGSQGTMVSGILGAGLNSAKAMSDAYSTVDQRNNAEKQFEFTSGLNVDQTNLQQSNMEMDINNRNSANYRNERSKYLSAIGTDLGAIGKEEVNKNQIAEALGYSWDGVYMVNKKTGEKKTWQQFAQDQQSNKPVDFGNANKFAGTSVSNKMYGGYLKTNKKGY
jgi:hypothetical protein